MTGVLSQLFLPTTISLASSHLIDVVRHEATRRQRSSVDQGLTPGFGTPGQSEPANVTGVAGEIAVRIALGHPYQGLALNEFSGQEPDLVHLGQPYHIRTNGKAPYPLRIYAPAPTNEEGRKKTRKWDAIQWHGTPTRYINVGRISRYRFTIHGWIEYGREAELGEWNEECLAPCWEVPNHRLHQELEVEL